MIGWLLLVPLTVAAWPAPAQQTTPAESRMIEAAKAVMNAAKYCFLITLDESGHPQARLMEPFAPDASLTVWMGTKPGSRKVAQIRRNARATLAYYDPGGPNYVTAIGMARVVDSAGEKRRHWRPEWKAFFPGGPEANYVVIEFTPSRVELISATHQIAAAPDSPGPVILERRGGRWTLIEIGPRR